MRSRDGKACWQLRCVQLPVTVSGTGEEPRSRVPMLMPVLLCRGLHRAVHRMQRELPDDIPEIPASPQCPGHQPQPPTRAGGMETSARAPAPCKMQITLAASCGSPKITAPALGLGFGLCSSLPGHGLPSLCVVLSGNLKRNCCLLNLVTNARCQHLRPMNTHCLCCRGNRLLCFNIFKLYKDLKHLSNPQ